MRDENGRHAAQHHELALREIDDVRRLVDQRKSECDQRVNGAHGEAGEDKLQQLGHRLECLASLTSLGFGSRARAAAAARRIAPSSQLPPRISAQSPPLISSIWNAVRSRPIWSVGDMFTIPPVPTYPFVRSISSRTLAVSALFARCMASTKIMRPS